jgi:hypothetical protein
MSPRATIERMAPGRPLLKRHDLEIPQGMCGELPGRIRAVSADQRSRLSLVRTMIRVGIAKATVPLPWTYAELTEFHTDPRPDGTTQVEIILWSDDTGITATCESISVLEVRHN